MQVCVTKSLHEHVSFEGVRVGAYVFLPRMWRHVGFSRQDAYAATEAMVTESLRFIDISKVWRSNVPSRLRLQLLLNKGDQCTAEETEEIEHKKKKDKGWNPKYPNAQYAIRPYYWLPRGSRSQLIWGDMLASTVTLVLCVALLAAHGVIMVRAARHPSPVAAARRPPPAKLRQ